MMQFFAQSLFTDSPKPFRGHMTLFSAIIWLLLFACAVYGAFQERNMEWVTPTFEEITLSCEINSYVNAEL